MVGTLRFAHPTISTAFVPARPSFAPRAIQWHNSSQAE
jgi:hypothetical protein